MSVAPHWNSPSLYRAACHGHAPGPELVPPTIRALRPAVEAVEVVEADLRGRARLVSAMVLAVV